jgi:hypothetical protein
MFSRNFTGSNTTKFAQTTVFNQRKKPQALHDYEQQTISDMKHSPL